jgi:2,3,4,5-tetrahydropyridine-2-carboxylate N-succinyltransferase
MDSQKLQSAIDAAWDKREGINASTRGEIKDHVEAALEGLDSGKYRVAENIAGKWVTHQWLKKAVLLSFRLRDSAPMDTAAGAYDKVPLKFAGWGENRFREAGFRAVPGSVVRHSAYIAPNVILMPCFVNVGARVDSGTMVDTWASVGSCAQIGKNCHISGGAVIIEDDCFIGARSEVVEGVVVERGSVLSMGVYIGISTKIIDRATGEIFYGRVPAYSVVVSGTLPGKPLPNGEPGPGLYCAVIVKRVDEKTRAKTSINELLRD